MKAFLKFFRNMMIGIPVACIGASIAISIRYIVDNFIDISTGSGWSVVLSFILVLLEICLVCILLHDAGTIWLNARKWTRYKRNEDANTTNGSSEDSETSNEAAGTSSKAKRHSKQS